MIWRRRRKNIEGEPVEEAVIFFLPVSASIFLRSFFFFF
jgi:hypothetical protein